MKIKKNGKFFKSLRFRILIILIILGIVPSVIVTEMVIANYEDRAIANRVQSMENICDIMCDLLIKENYLNDTSSQTVNSKLELLSNSYGGRILIVDRDFRIIKDTYGVDEGRTLVSQKVLNCFRGEDAYRYDSDSQKLILAVPVKSPDVKQVQGAMMIMASSSEVTATIHELEQKGILIIGIIVVLAIFLGYILSTILVKPFARVTKAIEDLTDGYQNEEISVPDYTETALITDAFNKMLSRMKTLDESRQEFVSNVSHELKTPMTSMKVLADSLVGQQGVPEELYQEFLSDITEEIDRENKIITDLLSLVKMDKKAADMNITNMNINELLENILFNTKGHGQLFCSLLGYRPCHNADEVIAAKQYDADHDVKNPSGSVFCAHGAGFFVPWNQVFDYMHIDTSKRANRDSSEMENDVTEKKEPKKQEEEWLDVSEIDSILERSSFANRKQGVVSHKGISAKRVSSVKEKPVGLSKPRKKQMPDVNYLLVDGYNIIFAWEELKVLAQTDIAAARGKLMDILCNYQGFHKCELILVFDAYRVANHKTEILDYHNIHVVYTKEAETADQYIEKFAHENGKKYRITVATSDGLEQIIIRGAGCRLLSARDFESDVKRSEQAIREILKEQ